MAAAEAGRGEHEHARWRPPIRPPMWPPIGDTREHEAQGEVDHDQSPSHCRRAHRRPWRSRTRAAPRIPKRSRPEGADGHRRGRENKARRPRPARPEDQDRRPGKRPRPRYCSTGVPDPVEEEHVETEVESARSAGTRAVIRRHQFTVFRPAAPKQCSLLEDLAADTVDVSSRGELEQVRRRR